MKKPRKGCPWASTSRLCVAIVSLFICFCALFRSNAQTCTNPPSGLVGWWQAEQDASDETGNHNGSLAGSATFGIGEVGSAFVLDGNNGCGVHLSNSADFQLQDLSMEAWVQRSSTSIASHNPTGGFIFGFGSGGYGLAMDDGGHALFTRVDVDAIGSSFRVTDQNWHHIAVTRSGTTVVFYLDGAAYPAGSYGQTFTFTTETAIGARGDNLANSFLGSIDELAIYNRALDSSEITAIYGAGSAGKCAPATPPNITTQPGDQTTPAWGSASFTVIATGSAPLRYQWIFNGTNLPGATEAALTLFNVQPDQAGSYAVQITNVYGTNVSTSATLTVNPAQSCTAPPAGLVGWWRCELGGLDSAGTNNGRLVGNATFGVGNVGNGLVLDGSDDAISLGTAASLRLQDMTIEAWVQRSDPNTASFDEGGGYVFGFNNGGYGLAITNNGRALFTQVGLDYVGSSFQITDTGWHHIAATKSGSNIVFYLDGVGEPPVPYVVTFTFTSGAALGARGGTFANSFLGSVDEVSVYNRPLTAEEIVAIYNAGSGGKCPSPTPPSINVQPQSVTSAAGTNASFFVAAAGSTPLRYQWLFQGTNLPAATNYVLTITNVQLVTTGSYQAIITNLYGSVTSVVATLTLHSPPVINLQPQSASVFPASTTQFLVGVSGSFPFYYQWFRNGTNLLGATKYSLLLSNVQVANTGSYTVVVTNVLGAVTSAPAILSLNLPPTITNQPASQSVPVGAGAVFTAAATGSGPLKYQWRFGGTNIANASSTALNLYNVQLSNGGLYTILVSNTFGVATSSVALLMVTNPACVPAPSGLVAWWQGEASPADSVSGSNSSLIGNAAYVPGRVGQAFSFDGNGDAVALSNSASLQFQDFTIETWVQRGSTSIVSSNSGGGYIFGFNNGGYGLAMFNDGHAVFTQVGATAINSSFQITDSLWHHLAVTKTGSTVTFYLDGVAFPSITYSVTFTFTTGAAIGARGDVFANSFLGNIDEIAIYNRALATNEIQALYYSTTQGKCGSPLAWAAQPVSQTAVLGSNATFSTLISGSRPITYRWLFNGILINAATNSSLTLTGLTYFQAGNYSVTATNSFNGLGSSNAVLTIIPRALLTNGSFETGNAGGWNLTDIDSPLSPIAVHGGGYNDGFGFFSSAPTDGNYCLTHGFDGNGPGRIRAAVDVVLPLSPVTLSFTYRLGWDMQNYPGSTQARKFLVTIEPYGGGAGLQTNTIFTLPPGTANYDTGNLIGSVDLSAFSGRSIRISFDFIIPESFTGPGFFQLDNVILSYPAIPPLLIARGSSNIVLSWPLVFSNFTPVVGSNLNSIGAWMPISTNLIVQGLTNWSMPVPATLPRNYYRLRSR